MPCIGQANETPQRAAEVKTAIQRLDEAIARGAVVPMIGAQGGIAFRGWTDNAGVSDLCAYRALTASNSPALRRAIARAEVQQGRKVNAQAVAAGVHSHDGGRTWGKH